MTDGEGALLLVFSDMDGSLLDHNDYNYRDALPQLRALEQLAIPVIPATSKTRVEVEQLRDQLGNQHPFIVENGAAVFIPRGYFAAQPAATVQRGSYWVYEAGTRRQHWLAVLEELLALFPDEFDYFFRAGDAGIAAMTGLPRAGAAQANQREYSEPVQWLGSAARREEFIAALREQGGSVLQGGRFLTLSGDCDKGRALAWLRDVYQQERGATICHDLAIGDSANDCAMLEAAETALLVRSPVHDFPTLARSDGVIYSTGYGPAGWAEGVAHWLHGLAPLQ